MSTQSFVAMMPREMMELRTRPLFAFKADVAKPSIIGLTPGHDRRVGAITGGSFEGERLRGKILPGGSDWQSLRSDGTLTLDVRCIMETDDGHLIGMIYRGMRHGPMEVLERIGGETVSPSEYYMRTAPFFETASEIRLAESAGVSRDWPSLGSRASLSGVRGSLISRPQSRSGY
jgi:Protein of unknown function (DUF3237)